MPGRKRSEWVDFLLDVLMLVGLVLVEGLCIWSAGSVFGWGLSYIQSVMLAGAAYLSIRFLVTAREGFPE